MDDGCDFKVALRNDGSGFRVALRRWFDLIPHDYMMYLYLHVHKNQQQLLHE